MTWVIPFPSPDDMLLIKPRLSNPAESCQWTMVPVIISSRSKWFTLMGGSCIVLEKLLTVHEVPNFPQWPLLIGPISVMLWFTVGVRGIDSTGRATQTVLLLCPVRPWSLALQLRVHSFAFTQSVSTHSHAEWCSQADCIYPPPPPPISLSLSLRPPWRAEWGNDHMFCSAECDCHQMS